MRAAKVFNGTFTIRNRETNEHRTFSIKTQPDDAQFAPGQRIVSLLTGPDNTHSYTGFAFINDNGIHVWKSKSNRGSELYKGWTNWDWMAEMLWHIAANIPHPRFDVRRYELMHEGRCLKCNRKLTTPESIESGIGPICARGGRDE